MKIPIFETERLVLREFQEKDAELYERLFADWEVVRHLSAEVPWPYPKGGVLEFFEREIYPDLGEDRWLWVISLKTDPENLIGAVDLWKEGNPENRGFWLGKQFWGHGYMTEAVEPIMDYAFDHLGFDKLVFANAVGNLRSRRVKEKTGATLLEVVSARCHEPSYQNKKEVWELSADSWRAHKKTQAT